ncbi:hypothetical protein HanIR_Chr10g0458821 [Helianthus annuus]|nr:hypothetical protein HanIR_Chr10g0458821 [Helianthus annuus]
MGPHFVRKYNKIFRYIYRVLHYAKYKPQSFVTMGNTSFLFELDGCPLSQLRRALFKSEYN